MSRDRPIRRLRQQTFEAIEARRRANATRTQRDPREVVVGDLYVLSATSNLPVEWAVLRIDRRLLRAYVVPADTQPLCGSGDITVAPTVGGPLQLRCRFGAWIHLSDLRQTHYAGELETPIVEQAWALVEQAEHTVNNPTEQDPIYQDWINDVLRPALAAIKLLDHGP